ncbi:MAG: N-acetyltransferase [Alphaproteobacteria bacterium]|nr:N-acetyltransferase [Alphaproteobacteria bacterium]NDC56760.1 N-acetyltransferase [Alphaproteobacteria bacterium]NDG04032.1 N-acetyltransferase [Alphaproteobacteria bacterium]
MLSETTKKSTQVVKFQKQARQVPTKNHSALKTPRLLLRGFETRDREQLFQLLNNWDVIRYMATPPYPYTHAAAAEYIQTSLDNHATTHPGIFAVTRAYDGALMGGCQIMPDGPPGHNTSAARLAYWLGRPYWGQGYVPEAAAAIITHAFQVWKVNVVTAYVHLSNNASCRVLEKIGFVDAGLVPPPALKGRRRGTASMHRYVLDRLAWRGTHQR